MAISGDTRGLSPSQKKKIERLAFRRIDPQRFVPLEFARELYLTAYDLKRRIGALISREGNIEEIFVGSKDILYLPDLGRHRFGAQRLRRLRLVFSDLSNKGDEPNIPTDVVTDLQKLRLDAVCSIRTTANRTSMAKAFILPQCKVGNELIRDLGMDSSNFLEFIENLESELAKEDLGRNAGGAVLVGVYGKKEQNSQASLNELEELAETAGVEVKEKILQKREPDPKTLLGKGKLEEVILTCLRFDAEMLIFDGELRPSQWRAITNSTELKVIDRSMLILDIFAQRASSSEGRLQVELAQLKYNLPRLVEKDTGLSRLTGGIGGRGPGETKLEIGRRRIRDRIHFLESKIEEISRQRQMRKERRMEREIKLISLIGYTNVGKSTLFNVLTKSDVNVEDKLFATLDPAKRKLFLGYKENIPLEVVLSDTVGFIRNLPNELKAAFRATLEEIGDASLLLHVLDASDPELDSRKLSVERILNEMGFDQAPSITVLNKIDKTSPEKVLALVAQTDGIPVSATSRNGLDALMSRIKNSFLDK